MGGPCAWCSRAVFLRRVLAVRAVGSRSWLHEVALWFCVHGQRQAGGRRPGERLRQLCPVHHATVKMLFGVCSWLAGLLRGGWSALPTWPAGRLPRPGAAWPAGRLPRPGAAWALGRRCEETAASLRSGARLSGVLRCWPGSSPGACTESQARPSAGAATGSPFKLPRLRPTGPYDRSRSRSSRKATSPGSRRPTCRRPPISIREFLEVAYPTLAR
jgi:hypothetical protein